VNETPDTLENTAAKEPRSAEFQPEYLDPSSPALAPVMTPLWMTYLVGQTVEKMNERFMVVAKNDYSRSFIQGLTERVAQEINHFTDLFFCFITACNIRKSDFDLILIQHFSAAFTKAHGLAAATLHLAHEENPYPNKE